MTDMNIIHPLRIGDAAPQFHARSTMGDIKLSDYLGKWLIFMSHPADFTPVCTSEFIAIAGAADRFSALDCALLGLSVDSLFSHLAWIKAIRDTFDTHIEFPVIEDPSMAIGRAFGMIDDDSKDSSTIRSTYFIDPAGIIRAITIYPHNVGRSVEEMLRMLHALQTVDDDALMTPEGWKPGERLLLPADITDAGDADWFCKRAGAQ